MMVNYGGMKGQVSHEWEDAIETCKEILAELADLPEAADDFVDSVENKVLGIQEWIEEHKVVTHKQLGALDNMLKGALKWKR
jgi:hypothetical protein